MTAALLLAAAIQTQDTCLAFVSVNLANGNGNWFTYYKVDDKQITFKTGDKLEYQVFLDPKNPVAKGGVDIDFTDNSQALRDRGLNDQNGLRVHGDGIIEPAVGKWYQRTVALDTVAGKTSAAWTLVFEGDGAGTYVQFVDDIKVTHSDGTKTTIYADGQPPKRELQAANGYTNKPACEPVPKDQISTGANLEPLIKQVQERAERLRVITEAQRDVDVVEQFAKRAPDPHMIDHVNEAKAKLKVVQDKENPTPEELQAAIHASRQALSHVHPEMSKFTGHLVGHAHIDLQWLWEWQEGIVCSRDTFVQALKFMDEVPGFTFSQSSPVIYQAIEETYPEVFEGIKQKVKTGQWELLGGRVCEGDTNMISPESHARQFLYGQRYFRERFGKIATVGWEPDTFGHTLQMPQILKQGGCDYYYFCRGGKGKPLFWWEGLDGTKILAFDEPATGSWYNSDISYQQFKEMVDFYDGTGSKDSVFVYGVGNHGGGPTREHLQTAVKWMQSGYLPNVKFSTATNFFKKLSTYDLTKIPKIDQELNPVFDGCYTTHSEIKQGNRDAEAWTTSAESTAAVASLFGFKYPTAEFRRNWEEICFNHHHDTLPGSGIHAPYEKSKNQYARIVASSKDIVTRSLELLTQRVTPKKGGISVMVFNPTGWTRSGWVNTYLVQSGWDPDARLDPANCVAESPDRQQHPVELLDINSKFGRFWAAEVPAFGYRVFQIKNSTRPPTIKVVGPLGRSAYTESIILENGEIGAFFDPATGAVSSLIDLKGQARKSILRLGRLEAHYEAPAGMSAWTIGGIANVTPIKPDSSSASADSVTFTYTLASPNNPNNPSKIKQTFRLLPRSDHLDVTVECDWNQIGLPNTNNPNLRLAFDTGLQSATATYEIPFGALQRPLDNIEYPALKWMDLSTKDHGIAILNDSKHGMLATGSTMRMTLIRSSFDPDPVPNPGHHVWHYAIYPHKGTWQEAGVARKAAEFNQPLLPATVPFDATGKSPLEYSAASVDDPAILPTVLKQAEDGDGLVMRMYESFGKPSTASITTSFASPSAQWVNFIEDKLGPAPLKENKLPITLHKFEIRNVKLVRKK